MNQEIVCVSGTHDHYLAVSKQGGVFGCGVGKTKNQFHHLIDEIKAAYAVFDHSLFLTREGKIISCGSNQFRELLLSSGPGKFSDSLAVTNIISGAVFCIAGNCKSVVFIGSSPPNSPNMRILE